MSKERDRLVDALLSEAMGAESPPDLTDRICRRAFPNPFWKNPWLLGAGLVATAALVAIVVSLGLSGPKQQEERIAPALPSPAPTQKKDSPKPESYPHPSATGDFVVAGGGTLDRGSELTAGQDGAEVSLGGYCRVEVDARSRLRIDGREQEEEVFLHDGRVTCEVDKAHGSFVVNTSLSKVSVTGTKFVVRLIKGDTQMKHRRLHIHVLAGAVLVASAWGETQVAAGEKHHQDERGTVTGVVVKKTDKSIDVRVDKSQKVHHFLPAMHGHHLNKHVLHSIHNAPIGSRVGIHWVVDDLHLRIEKMKVLRHHQPPAQKPPHDPHHPKAQKHGAKDAPKHHEITGVVQKVGDHWIDVLCKNHEKSVRFVPRWIGGHRNDGGGWDPEMLEQFKDLQHGDHVRITWIRDKHFRALKLQKQNVVPADGF